MHLNQLCYPSTTNITGVAEYRSLNYLDSASHEPRIETEIVTFGSNCPVATNVNAVIGFSHNKVNTRNLPIIYTSDSRDSNTDHCVGVRYEPSLVILFDDFMDGFNEYKNKETEEAKFINACDKLEGTIYPLTKNIPVVNHELYATYADKAIKLKGSGDYWYNEHIKSIVTKERFESMAYKVGE